MVTKVTSITKVTMLTKVTMVTKVTILTNVTTVTGYPHLPAPPTNVTHFSIQTMLNCAHVQLTDNAKQGLIRPLLPSQILVTKLTRLPKFICTMYL